MAVSLAASGHEGMQRPTSQSFKATAKTETEITCRKWTTEVLQYVMQPCAVIQNLDVLCRLEHKSEKIYKTQSTNGSEMEVAWIRARPEWEYPHVYVITIWPVRLAQKMQLNWSPAGAAHRASQAFDRPTLFATRLAAFLPQPTARKSSFFQLASAFTTAFYLVA